MADELSDVQRRGEEQRTLMEKKSEELEKQVMDLTSDLSKVNNDLRDSSANYELRVETLETKLKSSNGSLQVTWSINQLISQSIGQSLSHLMDRSVDYSFIHLNNIAEHNIVSLFFQFISQKNIACSKNASNILQCLRGQKN